MTPAAAPSPFRRPDTTVDQVPRPAGEPVDSAGWQVLMLAMAWFLADHYPEALGRWPVLIAEGAAKDAADHAAYNQALVRTLRGTPTSARRA